MTDRTINLDQHRGLASQHATELRRLVSDVEANEEALRRSQDEVERQLLARPAESWQEAADKARYLLSRYATTSTGGDARTRTLIKAVLQDFDRLTAASP